jgi:hypothetical protein
MPYRATLRLATLAALGGCTAEYAREVAVRYDSAGVEVVFSPAPMFETEIVLADEPVTVIRPDFGAPDHFLFRVTSAAGTSSGGLLVGNSGTSQVFRFDSGGALHGTVGRPGDGPGEARSISSLHRCDEEGFAVVSPARVNVYDANLGLAGSAPMIGRLADARAQVVGLTPGCDSVLIQAPSGLAPRPGDALVEIPQSFYWTSLEGGRRDTVVVASTGPGLAWALGGRLGWTRVPFGPRTVSASVEDRLVTGLGRDREISVLASSGAVAGVFRWGGTSLELSDGDWAPFVDCYQQFLREHPEEQAYVPRLETLPRSDSKPAYGALLADDAGRLWLQDYEGYGPFTEHLASTWSVLDASGRFVARVRTPSDVDVLAVTTRVLIGLRKDGMDQEYVVVYRLPDRLAP